MNVEDELTYDDLDGAAAEIGAKYATLTGSPVSGATVLDIVHDTLRERCAGRSVTEVSAVLVEMSREADTEADRLDAMLTSSVAGTAALTDPLASGTVSTGDLVPVSDEEYAEAHAPLGTAPGRVASEVSRILGLAAGQPGTQVAGEADAITSRHPAMFGGRPDRITGQAHEHRAWEHDDDPADQDQQRRGGADELAAEVDRIISAHNGNMFGMESPRSGSVVIRPKSPGHQALGRRNARPGRTSALR